MEFLGVQLLAGMLGAFPRPQAIRAGRWFGRLLHLLLFSRRAIALSNLRLAFPNLAEAEANSILCRSWENLGAGLADFAQMERMSAQQVRDMVEADGLEHLERSRRAGRGILIITAHYGAWEIGARFWPLSGYKSAVVARRVKNPHVQDWVTRVRGAGGVRVILAREAVRESIRWLEGGNMLAVLVDHRVKEGGLQVPFFGRPASTTSLPALLALRRSVPVHPARSWREGDKIRVRIDPAVDFSDLQANKEGVSQATARLSAIVESWVRERPEAWLWIHNRWKS